MNRRHFLAGAAAGTAIGVLDWLRFFRDEGVPGTSRQLGIAQAHAQAAGAATGPRFLIYWFQEGGWDGYSLFNPVDTRNDATLDVPAGTLRPTPAWSQQVYRPTRYDGALAAYAARRTGNVRHGYLAQDALDLLPEMAVVASHKGSTFHSGSRWQYHFGRYSASISGKRGPDERSVLHAFCEAYGASHLLPHVAWHRWLSDGELDPNSYPDGTGYYERLGPAHAHTVYGKTPASLRSRLQSLGSVAQGQRSSRIRRFVDDLGASLLADKEGESVRAFASAVQLHRQMTGGGGSPVDPRTLFVDPALREQFQVTAADEATSSASVNNNPARSKETPNVNVQAMMAYELMTKGLSIGFHIENRDIRAYDTHASRSAILSRDGQADQRARLQRDLWGPLKALVARLKATPYGDTGRSYYDFTTIVLASEMGRTVQGNVEDILDNPAISDAQKYADVMDQDCCQHWPTHSVAFLGGSVRANTQWGGVGAVTLDSIPLLPDGRMDPAYDPATGLLLAGRTKAPESFVSDAGHVYSTALRLAGLDPLALKAQGKGRNDRPPLAFVVR
jgi:hypothetical protein